MLITQLLAAFRRELADELAALDGVLTGRKLELGTVMPFQLGPQLKKRRQHFEQRLALCAEGNLQRADHVSAAAIKLYAVADGGLVFVAQCRADGEHRVRRLRLNLEAVHALHELFHFIKNGAHAHFRRGIADVFGQDLVDEVGAGGSHLVSQFVHLAHDIIHQHQRIDAFVHAPASFLVLNYKYYCTTIIELVNRII